MHADLSRLTFRPELHYSAVLAQQGRVQLDADANEQTAIDLGRARALTADLIGQHGGPRGATGFAITFVGGRRDIDDLTIGGGRYYVDGIQLDADRPAPGTAVPDEDAPGDAGTDDADGGAGGAAAADATWTYWDQPDAHRDPEVPGDRLPTQFPFVVYLKVWERSVTAAEDPALREVALGSAMPDTAARVKVVWQVLPLTLSEIGLLGTEPSPDEVRGAFRAWADRQEAPGGRAALRGERPERADEDPCLVGPDARYRGPENQLYRVEVHDGGTAKDATFKWSRENGSVLFPVDGLDGTWVELASLGGDDKLDLNVGDRVEFVDSAYASRLEPLPLLRVEEIDLPGRRVRLSGEPGTQRGGVGRRPELHPYLRRWDHRDGHRRPSSGAGRGTAAAARPRSGAVPIEEGRWLPLEDGVEVYFAKGGTYRTGDFWVAAARTATGSVEWPLDAARRPLLQAPAGIALHHAPLALIRGEGGSVDLRLAFGPLAGAIPAASEAELAAERQARDEEAAAESGAPNPRSQTSTAAEAEAEEETGEWTGEWTGEGAGKVAGKAADEVADDGASASGSASTSPSASTGGAPGAGRRAPGRGGRRHG
ncbi:hypothetical protein GCM10018793_30270 [Streptomyces sulfonofaciens]|uniref:Uncharacterized protein n=1 Tax=Streptomyces sulfonofaciens TaxID=68272 RepID=A0A919G6R2_9ACTN|nr:DUF6519 domain-containing protein [Streptomyces sulfonofaciens]GHH78814.1 hypothetical protein GCM10018793_30270 [Streptomyces sulfonofaciens]